MQLGDLLQVAKQEAFTGQVRAEQEAFAELVVAQEAIAQLVVADQQENIKFDSNCI